MDLAERILTILAVLFLAVGQLRDSPWMNTAAVLCAVTALALGFVGHMWGRRPEVAPKA